MSKDYFWVVLCKNHRFHHKGNLSYAHQIVLGETDAYSGLPMLTQQVSVRCDSCGEEYDYKATEILRSIIEVPTKFDPHPLFVEKLNGFHARDGVSDLFDPLNEPKE